VKTLYLHAGMHKTGSKSIQAYLAKNTEYFRKNGILVVNNADPWPASSAGICRSFNCFTIANVLIRNSFQTYARLSGMC
jgi:hypothetical protein